MHPELLCEFLTEFGDDLALGERGGEGGHPATKDALEPWAELQSDDARKSLRIARYNG